MAFSAGHRALIFTASAMSLFLHRRRAAGILFSLYDD
jgi:hypothetical protein